MRKHPSEQSRLCYRDAILTNGYPSSGAIAPPSPKGEGFMRRERAPAVRGVRIFTFRAGLTSRRKNVKLLEKAG